MRKSGYVRGRFVSSSFQVRSTICLCLVQYYWTGVDHINQLGFIMLHSFDSIRWFDHHN